MSGTANHGVLIARQSFPAGGRVFKPGDRFDPAVAGTDERRTKLMLDQGIMISRLTAESYASAIQRREPNDGLIGTGFTHDELVAMGIIRTSAPGPEPLWDAPDGSEIYRGYFMVPIKQANFTRWDVKTAMGRSLRPKLFRTLDYAQAYVDEIVNKAAESTDSSPSDTDDALGEEDDERDLQP